ncbi:MAG: DUF4142 domain-containing protein [Verrucomicrobia bacterium]|nr:DUF4142 domain-containing protein [Verrucomicrobiota bacterium]
MKKTVLINSAIAIAAVALSGTAFAADSSKTNTSAKGNFSSTDKSFIKDAAKGGMMEVVNGREAEKNATSAEVKKFGARMVADHGKANAELKTIAKRAGVELPGEPSANKWKSDKDYMDMMVKDHEKDLADFEKQAKDGTDADLKRFAEKTAKVVHEHLDMAKEIDGKLK